VCHRATAVVRPGWPRQAAAQPPVTTAPWVAATRLRAGRLPHAGGADGVALIQGSHRRPSPGGCAEVARRSRAALLCVISGGRRGVATAPRAFKDKAATFAGWDARPRAALAHSTAHRQRPRHRRGRGGAGDKAATRSGRRVVRQRMPPDVPLADCRQSRRESPLTCSSTALSFAVHWCQDCRRTPRDSPRYDRG
jgi:hypothetical protein